MTSFRHTAIQIFFNREIDIGTPLLIEILIRPSSMKAKHTSSTGSVCHIHIWPTDPAILDLHSRARHSINSSLGARREINDMLGIRWRLSNLGLLPREPADWCSSARAVNPGHLQNGHVLSFPKFCFLLFRRGWRQSTSHSRMRLISPMRIPYTASNTGSRGPVYRTDDRFMYLPAGAAHPAMTAPAEGTPADTPADHGFQRRFPALSTFAPHRNLRSHG